MAKHCVCRAAYSPCWSRRRRSLGIRARCTSMRSLPGCIWLSCYGTGQVPARKCRRTIWQRSPWAGDRCSATSADSRRGTRLHQGRRHWRFSLWCLCGLRSCCSGSIRSYFRPAAMTRCRALTKSAFTVAAPLCVCYSPGWRCEDTVKREDSRYSWRCLPLQALFWRSANTMEFSRFMRNGRSSGSSGRLPDTSY